MEDELEPEAEIEEDDDFDADEIEDELDDQQAEDAEEPEEGEPEAEIEEEEQPEALHLPTGEGPAQAHLKTILDPEVYEAVQASIAEQVQRATQRMVVGQASLSSAAVQYPELWKTHGRKISAALAMLPQDVQHTQRGIDTAMLYVIEDKLGTPQFGPALMKLAQAITGNRAAPAPAPKPPKAPLPAAQRAPSPSVAAPRQGAVTGKERRISTIMKDVDGLTREEAEDMASILNRRGRK